jgi:hypothetical protein
LSNPIKAKKYLVKLGTVKSIINTQLGNLTVECSDKQQYQQNSLHNLQHDEGGNYMAETENQCKNM